MRNQLSGDRIVFSRNRCFPERWGQSPDAGDTLHEYTSAIRSKVSPSKGTVPIFMVWESIKHFPNHCKSQKVIAGGDFLVRITALLVLQCFFVAQIGWAMPELTASRADRLAPVRQAESASPQGGLVDMGRISPEPDGLAPVNAETFRRLQGELHPEYDHDEIVKTIKERGFLDPHTGRPTAVHFEAAHKTIHQMLADSNRKLRAEWTGPDGESPASANARRIAEVCLEEGASFDAVRSGRASYQEALLLADSKKQQTRHLRASIRKFAGMQRKKFKFRSQSLKPHSRDLRLLGPEFLKFLDILGQEEVSEAELVGARQDFNAAADNLLAALRAECDKAEAVLAPEKARAVLNAQAGDRKKGRKARQRRTLVREIMLPEEKLLQKDLAAAVELIDGVKREAGGISALFHTCDTRYGHYAVEMARPSATGAWTILWTNLGMDPHFSPDEEIPGLAKSARPRCHATPDWEEYLPWATDIIESAPAYAAHSFMDSELKRMHEAGELQNAPDIEKLLDNLEAASQERVDIFVEREAMRQLYRRYAVPMAQNIDRTIASECAALAREFICRYIFDMPAGSSDEEILLNTRRMVGRGAITQQDVAGLALLIWHEYKYKLRAESLQEAERQGYESDRIEILRGLLYNTTGEPGMLTRLKNKCSGSGIGGLRAETAAAARAIPADRKDAYIAPDMEFFALKKQRQLPFIHISTTLAPTETRRIIFVLEEAMQLYMTSRQFGLEGQVHKRVKAYKARHRMVRDHMKQELTLEPSGYRMKAEVNRLFFLLNARFSMHEHESSADDPDSIRQLDEIIENELREDLGGRTYDALAADIVRDASDLIAGQIKGAARDLGAGINRKKLIDGEVKRRLREEFMTLHGFAVTDKTDELTGDIADYHVRKEILAESPEYGRALAEGRFQYKTTGFMPDVYTEYAPSRFMMGRKQVYSARDLSKIFAADHPKAYERALRFHSDYNYRPVGFTDYRLAETAKVLENGISRSLPSNASVAAADMLRSAGIGVYEQLRALWNSRGDRTVLAAGTGYPGYCIPKEFILEAATLLLRIDPRGFNMVLDELEILRNPKVRDAFKRDCALFLDSLPACPSREDIERAASEFFGKKYEEYTGIFEDITVTEGNLSEFVQRYMTGSDAPAMYKLVDALLVLYETGVAGQSWAGAARQLENRFAALSGRAVLAMEEVNRMSQHRKIGAIHKACRLKWNIDTSLRQRFGCPADAKPRSRQYEEMFQQWFTSRKLSLDITYKPEADDTRNAIDARLLVTVSGLPCMHYHEVSGEWKQFILDQQNSVFGDFASPTFAGIKVVSPSGFAGLDQYIPVGATRAHLKDAADGAMKALTEAGLKSSWVEAQAKEHGVDFQHWGWQDTGLAPDTVVELLAGEKVQMGLTPLAFCYAQDTGYTLESVAKGVEQFLVAKGVLVTPGQDAISIWGDNPEAAIEVNANSDEGDIASWSQIRVLLAGSDDKAREFAMSIIRGAGPAVHLYATWKKTYHQERVEDAITGVDIADLGIPGPRLLEQMKNLPAMLQKMSQRYEESAHIFISGSSAAEPPAPDFIGIEEEFAKLLFALDPKAVYLSATTGLEAETRGNGIERWRQEAIEERQAAETFYNAVMNRGARAALDAFDAMAGQIRLWGLARKARENLKFVKGLPQDIRDYYHARAGIFQAIENGAISPERGNLGSREFALSIGRLYLEGRFPEDEMQARMDEFDRNMQDMQPELKQIARGQAGTGGRRRAVSGAGRPSDYVPFSPEELLKIALSVVMPRPAHRQSPFVFPELGIATSLKDVADVVVERFGGFVARLRQERRWGRARARTDSLQNILAQQSIYMESDKGLPSVDIDIPTAYENAVNIIGRPRQRRQGYIINDRQYGAFLGYVNIAWLRLLSDVFGRNSRDDAALKAFAVLRENLNGEPFDRSRYAAMMNVMGDTAEHCRGNDEMLAGVARVAEMTDMAHLIGLVFEHNAFEASAVNRTQGHTWTALGEFFDATVGTRTYDYELIFMDRVTTSAFQGQSRKQYLAVARDYAQGWLYPFIRWMIDNHTEYSLQGVEYADSWLGRWHSEDDGRRLVVDEPGIGVSASSEDEEFLFSYNRLFDASQLAMQYQAAPIVIRGISPEAAGFAGEGVSNRVIWYPVSQHTVRTVLDASPALAQQDVNLFACPNVDIIQSGAGARKQLMAKSAYFKADASRCRQLLLAAGYPEEQVRIIEGNITSPLGVPVVIEFAEPVMCHSAWFHAFNVRRPEVDEGTEAYVIQTVLWESMCYEKCFYGEMYKGAMPVPPQRQIFMDRSTIADKFGGPDKVPERLRRYLDEHPEICPPAVGAEERSRQIRNEILSLLEETGRRSVRLYERATFNKPELESGGRGQEFFIYDKASERLEENLKAAINHGLDVLRVDDLVIQAGLPSYYHGHPMSESAVRRLKEKMASERAIPVSADTPTFNYARDIVALLTSSDTKIHPDEFETKFAYLQNPNTGDMPKPGDIFEVERPGGGYYYYARSHAMDIISTQPVGNAAREGVVLRHTPENIAAQYRDDYEFARREGVARSLKAQLVYVRKNWKKILADRMKHSPELAGHMLKYLDMEDGELPESFFIIPYEMGDYKEEWLVDEHDRIVSVYDYEEGKFIQIFDRQTGRVLEDCPISAFYDEQGKEVRLARNLYEQGKQRVLYFKNPDELKTNGRDPELYRVRALVVSKIEPNPGLGLWALYASEEALAGKRGNAAYTVMSSFGTLWSSMYEWAAEETMAAGAPAVPVLPPAGPPVPGPGGIKTFVPAVYLNDPVQQALEAAVSQLGIEGPVNEAVFTPEQVSVVLAFWMYFSRHRIVAPDNAALLQTGINCADGNLLQRLLSSDDYGHYRDFIAGQIVPEMEWAAREAGSADFTPAAIMIAPRVLTPYEADEIFGRDRINAGIVFNSSYTGTQNAVRQLQLDADRALGAGRVNVLGMPMPNLVGGADDTSDVVIYSQQGAGPVLYMLRQGLRPNYIRPGNLMGREGVSELGEHLWLAEWARQQEIPISCDEFFADLTGSKAGVYDFLRRVMPLGGVGRPEYCASGDMEQLKRFDMEARTNLPGLLQSAARRAGGTSASVTVYVQPDGGTEGRGVEPFTIELSRASEEHEYFIYDKGPGSPFARALEHSEDILQDAGARVLAREARGNLYYSDAEVPDGVEEDHRLESFRVNAGSSSSVGDEQLKHSFASSGFAMVAGDSESFITSTERGGAIEDINIALHRKSWYRDANGRWQKFMPTVGEIELLRKSGRALADMLKQGLCGMDFVLEVNPGTGRLNEIILLDVNARGVLRTARTILDEMPAGYNPDEHRMIAPGEFWEMLAEQKKIQDKLASERAMRAPEPQVVNLEKHDARTTNTTVWAEEVTERDVEYFRTKESKSGTAMARGTLPRPFATPQRLKGVLVPENLTHGCLGRTLDGYAVEFYDLPGGLIPIFIGFDKKRPAGWTWWSVGCGVPVAQAQLVQAETFKCLMGGIDAIEWTRDDFNEEEIRRIEEMAEEYEISDPWSKNGMDFIYPALVTARLQLMPQDSVPIYFIDATAMLSFQGDPLGTFVNLYNQLSGGGMTIGWVSVPKNYTKRKELVTIYQGLFEKLQDAGIKCSLKVTERWHTDRVSPVGLEPRDEVMLGMVIEKNSSNPLQINMNLTPLDPEWADNQGERVERLRVVRYSGNLETPFTVTPEAGPAGKRLRRPSRSASFSNLRPIRPQETGGIAISRANLLEDARGKLQDFGGQGSDWRLELFDSLAETADQARYLTGQEALNKTKELIDELINRSIRAGTFAKVYWSQPVPEKDNEIYLRAHLHDTLRIAEELFPERDISFYIACLGHDIDYACEDISEDMIEKATQAWSDDVAVDDAQAYEISKKVNHPKRCAEIMWCFLTAAGVAPEIAQQARSFIEYHDTGAEGFTAKDGRVILPAVADPNDPRRLVSLCDAISLFGATLGPYWRSEIGREKIEKSGMPEKLRRFIDNPRILAYVIEMVYAYQGVYAGDDFAQLRAAFERAVVRTAAAAAEGGENKARQELAAEMLEAVRQGGPEDIAGRAKILAEQIGLHAEELGKPVMRMLRKLPQFAEAAFGLRIDPDVDDGGQGAWDTSTPGLICAMLENIDAADSVLVVGPGPFATEACALSRVKGMKVKAVEITKQFCDSGRQTAEANGADVEFINEDIFELFARTKDDEFLDEPPAWLTWNPPYKTTAQAQQDGRADRQAMSATYDGGERGTDHIERLLKELPEEWKPTTKLMLAVNGDYVNARVMRALAEENGFEIEASVKIGNNPSEVFTIKYKQAAMTEEEAEVLRMAAKAVAAERLGDGRLATAMSAGISMGRSPESVSVELMLSGRRAVEMCP